LSFHIVSLSPSLSLNYSRKGEIVFAEEHENRDTERGGKVRERV